MLIKMDTSFLKYLKEQTRDVPEEECFHLNCDELGSYSLYNLDGSEYKVSFKNKQKTFVFEFTFEQPCIKLYSDSLEYEHVKDVKQLLESLGFDVIHITHVLCRKSFLSEDEVIDYVKNKFNVILEKGFHLKKIEINLNMYAIASKDRVITYIRMESI